MIVHEMKFRKFLYSISVLFLDVFCSDGSLLDGLTIKQITKKEEILFFKIYL